MHHQQQNAANLHLSTHALNSHNLITNSTANSVISGGVSAVVGQSTNSHSPKSPNLQLHHHHHHHHNHLNQQQHSSAVAANTATGTPSLSGVGAGLVVGGGHHVAHMMSYTAANSVGAAALAANMNQQQQQQQQQLGANCTNNGNTNNINNSNNNNNNSNNLMSSSLNANAVGTLATVAGGIANIQHSLTNKTASTLNIAGNNLLLPHPTGPNLAASSSMSAQQISAGTSGQNQAGNGGAMSTSLLAYEMNGVGGGATSLQNSLQSWPGTSSISPTTIGGVAGAGVGHVTPVPSGCMMGQQLSQQHRKCEVKLNAMP